MKTFDLTGKKRTELGKKASEQIRKDEKVPCVIYGGKEPIHFYAEEKALKDLIFTPHVYLVNLNLDGKVLQGVMQEMQLHPITDKVTHIDFIEVVDKKPVTLNLPITLTGISEGVMAGGKLRLRERYLKVSGLINKIPETIEIDITKVNIGQGIQVKDLNITEFKILNAPSSMILTVATSRAAAKAAAEAAAASNKDAGKKKK